MKTSHEARTKVYYQLQLVTSYAGFFFAGIVVAKPWHDRVEPAVKNRDTAVDNLGNIGLYHIFLRLIRAYVVFFFFVKYAAYTQLCEGAPLGRFYQYNF